MLVVSNIYIFLKRLSNNNINKKDVLKEIVGLWFVRDFTTPPLGLIF